jgi:L-iditol 2-dehydrogenase
MKMMKAAVLHAPGDIRCELIETPELRDDEVLVEVKAAGVCGSDIKRVMVTGTYTLPTIPGHEFSGVIADRGSCTSVQVGERVAVYPLIPCGECSYCRVAAYNLCDNYSYLGSRTDGGFAQFVRVPLNNLVPIPEGVDFETAAATEPTSVALHALRRAGMEIGDDVAIFGAGPIGLLVAQWARNLGAKDVFLVDIAPDKLELAMTLGFPRENCIDGAQEDAVQIILERTGGMGVSLAVESAGVNATLISVVQATRKHGRIVLLGNPEGEARIPSNVMGSILRKELRIAGTWNSVCGTLPVDEWALTLDFMKKGKIVIKPLISHRFPLEDAPRVFKMMLHKEETFNRVFFLPNDL